MRRFHAYLMATSIAVVPEKSECGDFVRWLRDFDCCACANGWNDEKKLTVLPAFLWGQASSYFHTLIGDEKNTYEHLTSALCNWFCSKVAREQHCHEFEQRALRPNGEPSLSLRDLHQLRDRSDLDLIVRELKTPTWHPPPTTAKFYVFPTLQNMLIPNLDVNVE